MDGEHRCLETCKASVERCEDANLYFAHDKEVASVHLCEGLLRPFGFSSLAPLWSKETIRRRRESMLTIFEDTVLVFSSVVTSPASSATSSSRKVLFSLRL